MSSAWSGSGGGKVGNLLWDAWPGNIIYENQPSMGGGSSSGGGAVMVLNSVIESPAAIEGTGPLAMAGTSVEATAKANEALAQTQDPLKKKRIVNGQEVQSGGLLTSVQDKNGSILG